jgi:acyl-coenzyme A thioesterase PaaI-like protein
VRIDIDSDGPQAPGPPAPFDEHARMKVREFAADPVERGVGLVVTAMGAGRTGVEVGVAGGPGDLVRVAVAVDSALGTAVHRATPTPSSGPTVDLRLDLVADPVPGTLTVDAQSLGHRGGAGAGRIEVRDATGQLVAHAVGTMVVEAPIANRSARMARFVDIPPLQPEAVDELVRRAPRAGSEVRVPLDRSLANLRGTVHGGVVLALGVLVQDRPGDPACRLRSATCAYLRPLPLAGEVVGRLSTVRDGRRFRTLRTELLLPDGRTGAVVTAIHEVLS